MSKLDWHPLRGIDQGRLGEARLQAHYAAQWLARTARGYIPPRPDDSHTNLGWDETLGGMTTHALKNGACLGLKFSELTLVLQDGGKPAQTLQLDGCADADARVWLGGLMSAKGFDAKALDAASPYEMPAHAIATGARYTHKALADALGELAAWYANANGALGGLQKELAARKLDAPVVRCWPHHFDLDTLISLGNDRSVGVGFSPGDEYYHEPYFYISVYPEPDAAALASLPAIGHWHKQDFTAAVATAGKIVKAADQKAETGAFLRAAVECALKALR